MGGSLGLAILVTVFGGATRAAARHALALCTTHHVTALGAQPVHQIVTHGMASSFTVAAVFDAVALLLVVLVLRMRQVPQSARAAISE